MLRTVIRSASVCVILASSLPLAHAIEPNGPATLAPISLETVSKVRFATALSNLLSDPAEAEKPYAEAIAKFYETRSYASAWIEGGKFSAKVLAGIDEIGRAEDWGLSVAEFDIPALSHPEAGDIPSYQRLADAELRMTRTLLTYVMQARTGRIQPGEFSTLIEKGIKSPNALAVLDGAAAAEKLDAYLLDFHPKHPQFVAFREQWLSVRRGETNEPNEVQPHALPDGGPRLKVGARHPDIAILRLRLGVPLDPAKPVDDNELYDKKLAAALKEFQAENDLKADGVITQAVRDRLNGKRPAPPEDLEELLLSNMERTRWLPDDRGEFRIEVNVPEYKVRVFDGDRLVHEERVVTGKVDTPTPVFSDTMEYVEFNPYWNVPDSIKVGEILPGLRNGGGLSRRGLQMRRNGKIVNASEIDWSVTDPRNFEVFQPPGPSNVLGVVKFMFPNHHAVYLHDTPSKALFNNSVRTFSHGCIRVRNPVKLAEVLFAKDQNWTPDTVNGIISAGENQQVRLTKKIPVHITYFTARIEPNGRVATFKDVYGVDRKTRMALQGKMNILLAEARAEKARIAERTRFAAVDADDPGFEPSFFGNGSIVKKKPKKTVFTNIFGFGDDDDSTVEVIKPRGKKRSGSGQDGGSGLKIVNAKKKTPLVLELLKKNR